jgi:hypothetical protein
MPRQLKGIAFLTFVLAVLFYLFFDVTKHQPALSQVNAFADDPYDAVGSFGVQLALFTALLSLVRAFRPYQAGKASDSQVLLLLRGEYFSCLAVAVTLVADIVAMIRHPAVWIGVSAGYLLAALVAGMALLTVLVGWLIHRSTRKRRSPDAQHVWSRAIGISVVSILILALYPESWRESVPGELFTVLVGAAFLFVPIWAIGIAISPSPGAFFEDVIDELAAVYRWLKAHVGPFVVLCILLEKLLGWPFVSSVLRWLNPRQYTWNLVILLGIIMGMLLALAEALGEGTAHQIGRFAMVAAIFIGLECAAVLLGYFLLAGPLGLFRHDSLGHHLA